MGYIFLSHSSSDDAVAIACNDWLKEIGHEGIFLDRREIIPGERWEDRLYTELSRCRAMIALVSNHWLKSPWCIAEVNHAHARGRPVFPLQLPLVDHDLYRERAPPILSRVQRIEWDGRAVAKAMLQEGLAKAGLDPRGIFALEPGRSPYPGFAAFSRQDAAVYFGRDTEITELLAELNACRAPRRPRMLIIQGASGAGKSSLLRAGILPRLERDPESWTLVPTFRPLRQPLGFMAEALIQAAGSHTGDAPPAADLSPRDAENGDIRAAWISAWANWIELAATAARKRAGRLESTVLLCVDQLEEALGGTAGDAFLLAVRDVLARTGPELMMVATLRADLSGRLQRHAMLREPWVPAPEGEIAELLATTTYSLGSMRRSAIADVITGPAGLVGLDIPPSLVGRLVSDTTTEDALPLLSFLLRKLWDEHGKTDLKLTPSQYDALGGLERAVTESAEAAMRRLNPTEEEAEAFRVALVFSMIEVQSDGRILRRRLPIEKASPKARRLLDKFSDARLITKDHETYELTHEALFRTWLSLKSWIQVARYDLQLRRRAEDAAAAWLGKQGGLWRPPDLDLLTEYDGRNPKTLSEVATAFLAESASAWIRESQHSKGIEAERLRLLQETAETATALAQEQETRADEQAKAASKARRLTIGVGALAFVAFVGALTAWSYQRRSEAAAALATANESVALTALSDQARRDGRISDALRLAIASWPRHSGDTRPALRRALQAMALATAERVETAPILLHEGPVFATAFSPDGRRVVTASSDHTARIWDADTGAARGSPLRHVGRVRSSEFSPNGRWIVTASEDSTARLWDATSGESIGVPMRHERGVTSAAFSPNGDWIVTASEDGTARLWDATSGAPVRAPMRHEGTVTLAAFSQDGRQIATVSIGPPGTQLTSAARVWDAATGVPIWTGDNSVIGRGRLVTAVQLRPDGMFAVATTGGRGAEARIWDINRGVAIGRPIHHADTISRIAFSPDGRRVLTASMDGTARLWEAATGEPISSAMRHDGWVFSAEFSPDGTRVLTTSADHSARLWNATSGERMGPPMLHEDSVAHGAFSPDGAKVSTASSDGTARIWQILTGSEFVQGEGLRAVRFSADAATVAVISEDGRAWLREGATGALIGGPLPHEGDVLSASFSPDGHRFVTASSDRIYWWDARTGAAIGRPREVSSSEFSTLLSPDGTRVMTISDDGTARLWDAVTGAAIGVPLEMEASLTSAVFGPDGRRVLALSADGTARLGDSASGAQIGASIHHDSPISDFAFSPSGDRLVTASVNFESPDQSEARLWDAASGALIGAPMSGTRLARTAPFSPDSRRLVTVSHDSTVRLWDADSGLPVGRPLPHESAVLSAVFSPDGRRAATTSDDRTARVWDAATGESIGTVLQHEAEVLFSVFSHDGRRLLTASLDRTVRLWDIESGARIGALMLHRDVVSSAAFSPDGTRVVTASSDRTAQLWDSETGLPIGAAMRLERIGMTVEFNAQGSWVLASSPDPVAQMWHARWPAGSMPAIACGLLPEIRSGRLEGDIAGLETRYGITVRDPICRPPIPPFDASRIDNR